MVSALGLSAAALPASGECFAGAPGMGLGIREEGAASAAAETPSALEGSRGIWLIRLCLITAAAAAFVSATGCSLPAAVAGSCPSGPSLGVSEGSPATLEALAACKATEGGWILP